MPRMTTCFFLIILVPYILVLLNFFCSSSRHQSNDYRLKTLKSIKMVSNLALREGLDCRGASLKPFVIDWGGRRCYGRWDVQGERWLGLITRRVGGGGQSVNYPCGGWGKGGRGAGIRGRSAAVDCLQVGSQALTDTKVLSWGVRRNLSPFRRGSCPKGKAVCRFSPFAVGFFSPLPITRSRVNPISHLDTAAVFGNRKQREEARGVDTENP